MKSEKSKKQSGITLIALVVTVVVTIIIAMISIATLTGDNGTINNAEKAKEDTEIAEEKEILTVSAVQAAGKDTYGNVEEDNLRKQLDINVGDYELEKVGDKFKVTFPSDRVYYVDGAGEVITESEFEFPKLSAVAETGDYVEYNINYNNKTNELGESVKSEIGTGWRVAYVDKENDIVKLIPEGVPLLESEEGNIGSLLDGTVASDINLMELEDIEKICEQSGINISGHSNGREFRIEDNPNIIFVGASYRLNTIVSSVYGDGKLWVYPQYEIFFWGSYDENKAELGIRPVITLKAGTLCLGGSGTKGNEYKIYQ